LGDHEALELSPNHRVLLASEWAGMLFGANEVLVKAKDLINDRTIRRRQDGGSVTYCHLLFDQHEIICGNGLESESYHPGEETMDAFDADTRAEILALMDGDPGSYGAAARRALRGYEAKALLSQNRN